MNYGIEVRNAAGSVIYGMGTPGFLFVEYFYCSGSTVVRTYPGLAGRTVFAGATRQSRMPTAGTGANVATAYVDVDYALGYPRVTATPDAQPCVVYVFAK